MIANNPAVRCQADICTHYVDGDYCSAAVIHVWHQAEVNMPRFIEQTQCKSYYRNEGLGALGAMHNMNYDAIERNDDFNPGVQCIISTCRHWTKGDSCTAKQIIIRGKGAKESNNTDCQTFQYSGQ